MSDRPITVRAPEEIIEAIDKLARPTRRPRNSWIYLAILEKLERDTGKKWIKEYE